MKVVKTVLVQWIPPHNSGCASYAAGGLAALKDNTKLQHTKLQNKWKLNYHFVNLF